MLYYALVAARTVPRQRTLVRSPIEVTRNDAIDIVSPKRRRDGLNEGVGSRYELIRVFWWASVPVAPYKKKRTLSAQEHAP